MPAATKPVMRDPDRQRARRVTEAMLGMAKLDVAALDAAAGNRRGILTPVLAGSASKSDPLPAGRGEAP